MVAKNGNSGFVQAQSSGVVSHWLTMLSLPLSPRDMNTQVPFALQVAGTRM